MKQFRSSYNRIVYLTCIALILIASAIEGGQYLRERRNTISNLETQVDEYASNINVRARSTQGYVEGLRETAEQYLYYIKNFNMSSPLWKYLKQLPGEDMYSLDLKPDEKTRVGNLAGYGVLGQQDQETLDELQMALLLSSAFQVAFEHTHGSVWVYYDSIRGFQSLFPWVPPSKPEYYKAISKDRFLLQAGPDQNPQRLNLWSPPYLDGDTNGSRFSRGYVVSNISPVYLDNQFLGAISIDIALSEFERIISNFHIPTGDLILFDEGGKVLGHNALDREEPLESFLESSIGREIMNSLKNAPRQTFQVEDNLVYMHKLTSAPWTLVYIAKPRFLFEGDVIHGLEDILIIALCLIFVVGIGYFVVTRDFISPAQKLLNHIEAENKGEPSEPTDLPKQWAEWFTIVSNIFKENRTLMEDLESRVKLRTQQLQKKNKKLEKALDDLKRAQDQIILQEKLASLGALTAGIAHEIKNPLHFIINFTDISIESLDDLKEGLTTEQAKHVKEVAENMTRVLEHANRADSIVKGMLSHARGSNGNFEYADLNKLITEAADLAYAGFCGKENPFPLHIKTDLDVSLPEVKVSSQDLSRVFLNIANNACHAMYEKLQSHTEGYNPILLISTQKNKNSILITIEDNGTGIPKSVQKKIFHPFFTTKETGKGTGLGLSLSYEILTKQHQGDLWLESEPNVFSRFYIKVPLDS